MQTGTATGGSGLAPRQIHVLMFAVMTGLFLAAMDGTIVMTALPTIAGDLGNLSQAPWIFVGYLLTQTIATPVIGKLSDLFGRKPTYQATIVVFICASVAAAMAQTMGQLVVLRGIQGIRAGGLLSLPMAIVGDLLPPRERARYQGYIAGTFAVAALAGPLAGGFFVEFVHWRGVFLVNVSLGALSLYIVQRRLRIPRAPTSQRVDYLGAIALTAAATPLVLALLWSGEHHGWASGTTVALLGLSAAGTAVFVLVEGRAAEPILPLGLFSDRTVRTTMIGAFALGIGLYGLPAFVAVFLQVVEGTTATVSGLLMAPNMAAITAASILSGRLISRTGNYKPYPVLGVATAGLSFVRSLGGAIGAAVLGAVYASQLNRLVPAYVGEDRMAELPDPSLLQGQPQVIRALPEDLAEPMRLAFADAITTAMMVAVPVLLAALVVFALIPRILLRDHFGER